jgi:phosphoglycolate phosphatase-like HAD superfamily hydrolase
MPRRLFLFDIDGTLILGGGAGETALRVAMLRGFGRAEGFDRIILAGATDKNIAMELLRLNEQPVTPENVARVIEHYLEALQENMAPKGGAMLPGTLALLEALHTHPECALGLLTGNVEQGAKIKLTHFGVWHYFPFGAFADDHHDRNQLGPFARERARRHHGKEFPPDSIVVIGDTPKDIACGKAFGARTVAVATGNYSSAELAAHEPDWLFEDLSDTAAVLQALLPN